MKADKVPPSRQKRSQMSNSLQDTRIKEQERKEHQKQTRKEQKEVSPTDSLSEWSENDGGAVPNTGPSSSTETVNDDNLVIDTEGSEGEMDSSETPTDTQRTEPSTSKTGAVSVTGAAGAADPLTPTQDKTPVKTTKTDIAKNNSVTSIEEDRALFDVAMPVTPSPDHEELDLGDPLEDPSSLSAIMNLTEAQLFSPPPAKGADDKQSCSPATINSNTNMDVDPETKVTRSPDKGDKIPAEHSNLDQCQVPSIDNQPTPVTPSGNERQGVESCDSNLPDSKIAPAPTDLLRLNCYTSIAQFTLKYKSGGEYKNCINKYQQSLWDKYEQECFKDKTKVLDHQQTEDDRVLATNGDYGALVIDPTGVEAHEFKGSIKHSEVNGVESWSIKENRRLLTLILKMGEPSPRMKADRQEFLDHFPEQYAIDTIRTFLPFLDKWTDTY